MEETDETFDSLPFLRLWLDETGELLFHWQPQSTVLPLIRVCQVVSHQWTKAVTSTLCKWYTTDIT